MRVTRTVVSKATDSTTIRNADATQLPNGNVPMVSASASLNTVMENSSAKTDPMRNMRTVATKASSITTSKSVAATRPLNSPARPVNNAYQNHLNVTVKLNAKMDLMRKTAASKDSHSTTRRNVAATPRPSTLVTTVSAF